MRDCTALPDTKKNSDSTRSGDGDSTSRGQIEKWQSRLRAAHGQVAGTPEGKASQTTATSTTKRRGSVGLSFAEQLATLQTRTGTD